MKMNVVINRNLKRILGGIFLLGLFAGCAHKGAAVNTPDADQPASGSWDDARGELQAVISNLVNKEYDVFVISQSNKDAIVNCIVDRSIAFLNTTECTYSPEADENSETQHEIDDHATCLEKVNFSHYEEGFTVECTKANMPNNWQIMEKIFTGVYEEVFTAHGIPAPAARQSAQCISQKLMALCDERQYVLINESATEAKTLFFPINTYIPDIKADTEAKAILDACAPSRK